MRELGQRTAREGVALFGAACLHLVVLALVAYVAAPLVKTSVTPKRLIDDALDVDLVPAGSDESTLRARRDEIGGGEEAKLALLSAEQTAGVPEARRVLAGRRAEPAPAAALEMSDVSAALPPTASGPAPAEAATADSTPARPLDLGLGESGWQRWLSTDRTGVAPPPATPHGAPLVKARPASSTGGLQEGLAEAELKRSAGPGGRVVNALEDAAHGDGATAFGVARFAVTVLRTGGVEVRLESASTGEAEWKRVAERAAANLRANAPTIRPPSDGARFVVDLSAEMLLVDGRHAASLHGPRVEAKLPRVHTWSAGKADMLRNNPTAASGLSRTDQAPAIVELPGVYVAQKGKVCSYRIGLSILGPLAQGGCELSNLGTKPQRVVHAHVTGQELF